MAHEINRLVDLRDLASVRALAIGFRKLHKSLDLLINNAGIMWTPYAQSLDGFESQMAALQPEIQGGDYVGPQGRREMKGAAGKAHGSRCARDLDAAKNLWELSGRLSRARFCRPKA
jgi:NAD(P)-dependent dehydrogenase (short-subunit alcohol dehydrogenase family)